MCWNLEVRVNNCFLNILFLMGSKAFSTKQRTTNRITFSNLTVSSAFFDFPGATPVFKLDKPFVDHRFNVHLHCTYIMSTKGAQCNRSKKTDE